jgi:hypothetical protein
MRKAAHDITAQFDARARARISHPNDVGLAALTGKMLGSRCAWLMDTAI